MKCFVADDHCDAFSCIVYAIRKKILKHTSGFTLVHFDAHPDLSYIHETEYNDSIISALDVAVDLSNSMDGIASWIIPLIYFKILDKIVWIKTDHSNQFPTGNWTISLYKNEETHKLFIQTNAPTDYYEESSERPLTNLLFIRNCELIVINHTYNPLTNIIEKNENIILDICCDYFECRNPIKESDSSLPEYPYSSSYTLDWYRGVVDLIPQVHLITIAKSEGDDYCSKATAFIQSYIIPCLLELFHDLELTEISDVFDCLYT